MTVAELSAQLTQEELIGWAAFYELKGEEEDRAKDRARTNRAARSMTAR